MLTTSGPTSRAVVHGLQRQLAPSGWKKGHFPPQGLPDHTVPSGNDRPLGGGGRTPTPVPRHFRSATRLLVRSNTGRSPRLPPNRNRREPGEQPRPHKMAPSHIIKTPPTQRREGRGG
jgi:hypothetical protein